MKLDERAFRFEWKEKRYYPNKSLDRIAFGENKDKPFEFMVKPKPSKWQIDLKTISKESSTNIEASLLATFQKEIFEETLNELHNKSSILQTKIDILKRAIDKKEAKTAMKTLENQKQSDLQKMKAREMLAHFGMEESFKSKLEACSFRWATE